MSVRVQKDKYGETQIRVDQHWPDGTRYRRNFPNRRLAEGVDSEIRVAKAKGSWRELRERLARGADAERVTVAEFADRYLEEYCKVHTDFGGSKGKNKKIDGTQMGRQNWVDEVAQFYERR